MQETIQKILSPGKGILALDWSPKTIAEKFTAIGLQSTPELNRKYRQMLLTTPGIENYVSGVILHEETARQSTDDGFRFPDYLSQKGIVPGIKVDKGGEKFPSSDEEITTGLEDLDTRLKDYSTLGVKFTKWRSLFKISDIYPSKEFLDANLDVLVSSTKIILANDMVPIIEPEVSMKGNHTTTRCAEITTQVLALLFEKLNKESVNFNQIILKTNMVLPGQDNGIHAAPLEVAEATLRTFRKSVPSEVQGIVFLSGGQSPDDAINNLNEVVKRKSTTDPWDITFSYARALQGDALNAWAGKDENIAIAQEVFIKRLEMVCRARKGEL